MTITIGLWLIPAAITIASFGWAWSFTRSSCPRSSSYGPDLSGAVLLIVSIPAIIASLVSWLIWALLT